MIALLVVKMSNGCFIEENTKRVQNGKLENGKLMFREFSNIVEMSN
jgi:hypothetical protein